MAQYQKPPFIVAKIANPVINFLVRRFGIRMGAIHVLSVKGRTSGKTYSVPVNLLEIDGRHYVLSPRGETDWVKNLRAAGVATVETRGKKVLYTSTEVAPYARGPMLKEYVTRWGGQVKGLIEVGPEASADQFAQASAKHPVFEIEPMRIA